MIKLFEQHSKEHEIHSICEEYDITNYTINDDFSIDVDGDVDLSVSHIRGTLPLKFNRVTGHFNCEENTITSLLGFPIYIGGELNCCANNIKSLEHSPNYIGLDFYCSGNELTTLKGITDEINGGLYCGDNNLISLEYFPKHLKGDLNCNNNKLTNLKGCPTKIDGNFICSYNKLTTLEYSPPEVSGILAINGNQITSFKGISTDFRDVTYGENPFPPDILKLSHDEMLILIKYYDEYGIWNSDNTFNSQRFNIFKKDLKSGALKI